MLEPNVKRVERILKKLTQVQQKGLSCFGSDRHNFRLNPPIKEETVQRFEATQGVSLPADYRCFLMTAGDGGAGPYYGLYKLNQWDDFTDWTIDDPPSDFLSLTTKLTEFVPQPAQQSKNLKLPEQQAHCQNYFMMSRQKFRKWQSVQT